MSVLYNYKGMQSVVPETRRALPALPFWVGPGGKQSKNGRVNGIIPLVIIDSSHVTLSVKGFSARKVIGWGFLEGDLAWRSRNRGGIWTGGWGWSGGRSWSWSGGDKSGILTRASAFVVTFAVEVGRVLAREVGLALIDLDTREVSMVLGEVHPVTKHESIAGGAPFSESLASMRDRDFFRWINS